MALSIAIEEAADKIINEEFTKAVYDSTLTNAAADRVSQLTRKEYTWCKVEKYQQESISVGRVQPLFQHTRGALQEGRQVLSRGRGCCP